LPTLRFSREFGLVLMEICFFCACILQIAYFSNFWALLLFEFTAKSILSVFL